MYATGSWAIISSDRLIACSWQSHYLKQCFILLIGYLGTYFNRIYFKMRNLSFTTCILICRPRNYDNFVSAAMRSLKIKKYISLNMRTLPWLFYLWLTILSWPNDMKHYRVTTIVNLMSKIAVCLEINNPKNDNRNISFWGTDHMCAWFCCSLFTVKPLI